MNNKYITILFITYALICQVKTFNEILKKYNFNSLNKYICQFWLLTISKSSLIFHCKGDYSHEEVELLPRMTALGNNQSPHRTLNMPVRIKAKGNNISYIYIWAALRQKLPIWHSWCFGKDTLTLKSFF